MFRLGWVILINAFRLIYMLPIMRRWAKRPNKYPEEKCYRFARHLVRSLKASGGIRTKVYGLENLPEEGGYMMYPNHQGKFDVYGIISVHKKPLSFVMDKAKSYRIFMREVVDLLKAKRLDKEDVRQAITIINEVAKEVKHGRRFILFPEGEYITRNKNRMGTFKPGCFKISLISKTPIVPVVLVDSYKVFNGVSFPTPRITSQVHFLPPIHYEEYKNMKTQEIAQIVQERIQKKLKELRPHNS